MGEAPRVCGLRQGPPILSEKSSASAMIEPLMMGRT